MQSSITVLGLTEKVHDIGSSSVLGTTRDIPILKPTRTGPLILLGDIHSVSAAVRQGSIFCCPQRGAWIIRWQAIIPIKLQLRGDNFVR